MIFETKKKRYDIEDAKNKIVLLFDYEKMCSLIANTTYSRVFMTLKEVKEYFNVPVIISKIDAGRLEDEELINERPYVKIPYKAVKADILICEDDIINLDELSFSFLGMPGHTDGSMAIIVNDNIFSGDTIMFEKHGKTSLPGGNEKLLISSIEKMMNTLIGDYKIFPGHRQETSLDHERKCRLSTVITGY